METNQERAAHLVRHAPGSEHLLELSFGCEVKWCNWHEDGETFDWREGRVVEVGEHIYDTCPSGEHHQEEVWYAKIYLDEPYNDCDQTVEELGVQNIEIIGHTPTLADYLRVLDKDIVNLRYETNHLFVQVRSGTFVTFNLTGDLLDEENAAKFISLIEGV